MIIRLIIAIQWIVAILSQPVHINNSEIELFREYSHYAEGKCLEKANDLENILKKHGYKVRLTHGKFHPSYKDYHAWVVLDQYGHEWVLDPTPTQFIAYSKYHFNKYGYYIEAEDLDEWNSV